MSNEDFFNNEGKMTGVSGHDTGTQSELGYGDPSQSYQQNQTEANAAGAQDGQQGSYYQNNQQQYSNQPNNQQQYSNQQNNQQQSTYYQQVQPDDRMNYRNQNQQGGYQTELEEPISMGDWLVTLLLVTFVPCVNIVLMFVWAFSNKEKKSKSNYFKAQLIMSAIMIVFYIILFVSLGAYMGAIFSNFGYYPY